MFCRLHADTPQKVQGMQVLHDIFIDDKLDFFILFSSVASAFPLLGNMFCRLHADTPQSNP
jgi:hypothetical protein